LILILTLSLIAFASTLKVVAQPVSNLSQYPAEHSTVSAPTLNYYHKYEQDHHQATPLPTVPLEQHYHNERENRKQAFKLKHKAASVVQHVGYKVRDLKRKVLRNNNEKNQENSNGHAFNLISSQKLESVKEEINHDEKMREIYVAREQKNARREQSALPNQQKAYQKLRDFDHKEARFFRKRENQEQNKLMKYRNELVTSSIELNKSINELETANNSLNGHIKNAVANSEFKIAKLQEELRTVEHTVKLDEELDQKRRNNESNGSKKVSVAETNDASKILSQVETVTKDDKAAAEKAPLKKVSKAAKKPVVKAPPKKVVKVAKKAAVKAPPKKVVKVAKKTAVKAPPKKKSCCS